MDKHQTFLLKIGNYPRKSVAFFDFNPRKFVIMNLPSHAVLGRFLRFLRLILEKVLFLLVFVIEKVLFLLIFIIEKVLFLLVFILEKVYLCSVSY